MSEADSSTMLTLRHDAWVDWHRAVLLEERTCVDSDCRLGSRGWSRRSSGVPNKFPHVPCWWTHETSRSEARYFYFIYFYRVSPDMAEPCTQETTEQTEACLFLRQKDPFSSYSQCFNCSRRSVRGGVSRMRKSTRDIVRNECAFKGDRISSHFTS